MEIHRIIIEIEPREYLYGRTVSVRIESSLPTPYVWRIQIANDDMLSVFQQLWRRAGEMAEAKLQEGEVGLRKKLDDMVKETR